MLCSVVKHAGSSRAGKKCRGKHEMQSSVFPHFISALQQNRAQLRLLSLFCDEESKHFPRHSLNFQTMSFFCSLIKHAKIGQS